METSRSFEGWDSGPVAGVALDTAIELAFDYRGDVTLTIDDGAEVVGFLFNRDRAGREPFVELFERDGGARRRLPFASIRRIRCTGRDPAAGTSYAAWLKRRDIVKAADSPRSE